MTVEPTSLAEVLIIKPDRFEDPRGHFLELWRKERYAEVGIRTDFVQDNLSHSVRGTLRGLHLQVPDQQAKLVTVLDGEVFDVAVDVRVGSPTFGRWVGMMLNGQDKTQLFIPGGFAHGFQVVSETALFHYKTSAPYRASSEITIAWHSSELAIPWPVAEPKLSPKDASAPTLEALKGRLPMFDRAT